MTPLAALSPVAPLVLLLLLLCFPTNALPPLTASPPSDPNLNPSVANGLLGLTTPLDAIYVNGVFTRDLEYLIGGCLSLPADILLLNPLTRYELSGLCQSLDKLLLDHPKTDIVEHGQGTRKARFTNPYAYIPKLLGAVEPLVSTVSFSTDTNIATYSDFSTADVSIVRGFYAHSLHTSLLVHNLTVTNDSPDHHTLLLEPDESFKRLPTDIDYGGNCHNATVLVPAENAPSPTISFCFDAPPASISLPPNSTQTFTYTLVVQVNPSTPLVHPPTSSLLASHIATWSSLTSSTLKSPKLSPLLASTLAALQSSLTPHSRPASPGGLPTNGYFGNVFWDSDLWIATALLPIVPAAVKSSLQFRVDHMDAARKHAKEHGYSGCFFPWQVSGGEVDTSLAPFANLKEQHLGGDIAVGLEAYYWATGDEEFMSGGGTELVECISEFYMSRSSPNEDGSYSIRGVVPPDEFAKGKFYSGVDDSVFTNWVAKRSLQFASEIGGDEEMNARYRDVAEGLRILYDEEMRVHPEYEGFPDKQSKEGVVKQADVTLLIYPGDMQMDTEVMANDLEYYEGLYFEGGPAMTFSTHTIGWLEVGDVESARANMLTSMLNVQEPFNVWTETPNPTDHPSDMGCYNFLTGAGGFVQSVVHGYGGVRWRKEGMRWRVVVDEEVFGDELVFERMQYRGNVVTVRGEAGGSVEVTLMEGGNGDCELSIDGGEVLEVGVLVRMEEKVGVEFYLTCS